MPEQPLTFLTGATGFVGAAVARVLEAKGHRLRLLVRPGGDRRNLDVLTKIELVEGDLTQPATYYEALQGCQALFHVAADYRLWAPHPAALYATNVEGTAALMDSALALKIPRIVYTSSVATLGARDNGTPTDETATPSLHAMVGAYKGSKFLAEEKVRQRVRSRGLPCVIVNPSTPIGPRDIKPTPTGRILVEVARHKVPAYIETGLNIVHVDDVAEGHWLAFERGRVGERYILGGENVPLGTLLGWIAEASGAKPPRFKIPRRALYPAAYLAEALARFTGREPFLTVDALRMAAHTMFFSSAKAENELGYHPRPAREAIADALKWFQDHGYC